MALATGSAMQSARAHARPFVASVLAFTWTARRHTFDANIAFGWIAECCDKEQKQKGGGGLDETFPGQMFRTLGVN